MDFQADFAQQMGQLQKAIQHQRRGKLISTALILAVVLAVLIFFVQQTLFVSPLLPWLYAGAVGVAIAATLLVALKFKKTIPNELVRLDQHFNLKEQLRSAYEVHQSGQDSFVGQKLIAGASRSLKNIHFKSFYPQKWAFPCVVVMGGVGALFLIGQLPKNMLKPENFSQASSQNDSLPSITLKLENLTQVPLQPAREAQKPAQTTLEKKFQAIAKTAERPDFSESQAFQDLPLLQEEINTAQMQIAKNLFSQISPSLAEKIPTLEEFLEEGASLEAIDQLENELQQQMDHDLPADLREDLGTLKKNQAMQRRLEGLAQEQKRTGGEEQNLASDFPFQEAPQGLQGHSDALHFMLDEEFKGDQSDSFFWMEQNSPLFPGDQGGSGKRQAPTRVPRQKNQISKIEGLTGEGKRHQVTVQTLTAIGQAEVEARPVVRSYAQDWQTVFQKETIPLQERGLVKSYFLAIDEPKANARGTTRR